MERFSLKKLNEEQHRFEVSNRFASSEETVTKNISILAKESQGYYASPKDAQKASGQSKMGKVVRGYFCPHRKQTRTVGPEVLFLYQESLVIASR
jgi:hypothetical protein